MLSSLFWIPGSVAKAIPVTVEPTEDQLEDFKDIEEEEEDNMEEDTVMDKSEEKGKNIEEIYNLDTYDDDDEEVNIFGDELNELMKEGEDGVIPLADDDEQEELDDLRIKPTDALIVAAHSEDDLSQIFVYVYEESENNLYVHHDIFLASFPLCLEWTDCHPTQSMGKGNLAAVGSFLPGIEIWDLDVLDPIEPVVILGGFKNEPTSNSKKKKKKKIHPNHAYKPESHKGAVMSLSWNKHGRNIIASGSADHAVKVWDINQQSCLFTFTHHQDKVQALEWHPTDPQILLCGSYDQKVSLLDARYPNAVGWSTLTADTEAIQWDIHTPHNFMVSTEDGNVKNFDSRKLDAPIWTLQAHTKTCSALNINPGIPEFFATGSADKTIKLWSKSGGQPKLLHTIQSETNVFTLGFYSESPLLLVAGGKSSDEGGGGEDPLNAIRLWHCSEFSGVTNHFNPKS